MNNILNTSDYENTENSTQNGKTDSNYADCNYQHYFSSDFWIKAYKKSPATKSGL